MKKDKHKNKSKQTPQASTGDDDDDLMFGAIGPDDTQPIDMGRIMENVTQATQRHLGAANALREAIKENTRLRRRCRKAEAALEDNREFIDILDAGGEVLNKDEAAIWAAFNELKLKPEELKTKLEQLTGLETETTQTKRGELIKQAAEAMNWNGVLLKTLITDALTVKFQPVKQEDKTMLDEPFIVTKGTDGKEVITHMADYAEANWKTLLSALESVSDDTDDDEQTDVQQVSVRRKAAAQANNGGWVSQGRSTDTVRKEQRTDKATSTKSVASQILKKKYPVSTTRKDK